MAQGPPRAFTPTSPKPPARKQVCASNLAALPSVFWGLFSLPVSGDHSQTRWAAWHGTGFVPVWGPEALGLPQGENVVFRVIGGGQPLEVPWAAALHSWPYGMESSPLSLLLLLLHHLLGSTRILSLAATGCPDTSQRLPHQVSPSSIAALWPNSLVTQVISLPAHSCKGQVPLPGT